MQGWQPVAGDIPDDISRLELRIEELARSMERSKKAILISKLAIAGGGVWALALLFGAVSTQPLSILAAVTAMIGGIVGYGSNTSTLKEQTAAARAAERLRSELIDRLNPRVVDGEEEMVGRRGPV